MNDLVRSLLTMSVIATVVALILFAIKPLIKNRLPKMFQYYIWLVVFALLLVPINIKIPVATPFGDIQANTAEAPPRTTLTVRDTVDQYIITTNELIQRTYAEGIQPSEKVVQTAKQNSPFSIWLYVAVALWPAGIALFLLWNIVSYLRFCSLLKKKNSSASAEETTTLQQLCPKHTPALYKNPVAPTPMLIGLIRPQIILPDREYEENQMRNILLHELTHMRRRDVAVKWLMTAANAIHWFNPIIYLVRSEMNKACELSCDEAVIHAMDNADKQRYGDTLIAVTAESRTPAGVLSTTMCEDKKTLRERLVAIMKYKKGTRAAILTSVALAFVVAVSGIALGASFVSPEPHPLSAAGALQQLEQSVISTVTDVSFEIPSNYMPSTDWNILVTGRAESADGFSMSAHLFESENETHTWEPGKRYYVDITDKGYTELLLSAYLTGQDDEPLEIEIDLLAAVPSGISDQQYEAVYSPDGKYYIEAHGVNASITAGGLFPTEEIRMIKVESGETVWRMEPGYYEQSFIWSSDSRYVSVYYMARTWGAALAVDTEDMSEHLLPGLTELAPYFPDAVPDKNRPDPYIVPLYWTDDHTIFVECKWISSYAQNEANEFFCRYSYNVDSGALSNVVEVDGQMAVPKYLTYEAQASLHDGMPEYRFVANGYMTHTGEWGSGCVLGLEGYDENGKSILSADFSRIEEGQTIGNFVYNQMMDTMGLHIVDVNFDGYKDVIILSDFGGAHSNTWYNCWLWDVATSSFVISKSFSEICNPALDAEKKCIYSAGGSGASYWGGQIYKFVDGEFVMTNDLNTDERGLVESKLVNGKMEVVRETTFYNDEKALKDEMEYYRTSELWQLENPRWYWYGGHHADQWLD